MPGEDWQARYARYARQERRGRGSPALSGARTLARTLVVGASAVLIVVTCLWIYTELFQGALREMRDAVFYAAVLLLR